MSSNNNDDSYNENTCVVCFKNVDLFSIGDCDHPVCFECSTRMRVLCRQNECPICRHDMQKVIFTKSVRPFKQLERTLGLRTSVDRKFQIVFESAQVQAAYDALLAHICPKCPSRHAFQTFNHLREHVRKEHELFYCDLCVDNLKILTQERKCYNRTELAIHRRQGDPDDRSHRGHPLCEFCDVRYNDNDELYRHLRRDHLFCHFCDTDGLHQYYQSYEALRNHFRNEHFLCEEGECYDEKFTPAFRTEIDLKAHRASVHGKQMTKAAAKQARTLELAFTVKPRARQTEHRRGGSRGAARYQSHSDEEEGAVGGMVDNHRMSQQSGPSFSKFNTASNDEFPLLGGNTAAPSIQGVHFRKPGVTIRAGPSGGLAITDEDFPALGPEATTSVSLRLNTNSGSAAERAKSKPTNVSIHVNHRPNSVVTTVSRPRDSFPGLGNDFPALNSKALSQPPTANSQWTTRESRDSEPKFSVKTKQSSNQPQQKSKQKTCKKMHFDEDSFVQNNFPALGGNVPSHIANLAATQWSSGREPESKVSVNKNKSNQPPPKLPQPKTFHIEDDFPSLSSRFDASCNIPSSIKSSEMKGDTRPSEMKNKKESSISIPVDSECNKVAKNSLNNDTVSSDSEIGSKKGNKKKKNKSKSKKESSELTNANKTVTNKSTSNNNNNEPKTKNKQKEESKPKAKQMKVEEQLENPPHKKEEAVEKKKCLEVERKRSELKIESVNGYSHPENKIDLNDFPSLNSNRVPPGFYGAEKPQAPPGFESTPRPPPGFSITLNSVARPQSNGLTFTSSSGQNYPITPGRLYSLNEVNDSPGDSGRVFSYISPVNIKQRNPELVQRVTDALKTKEALDDFLQMSSSFRQGTVDAEPYYNHCKGAMGDAAFADIFPELLALLPDIDKQQELWRVAERRRQWKLQVCAVCSQVVTATDFKHHHMSHSLENHFPALSNGLSSPTNAWKK